MTSMLEKVSLMHEEPLASQVVTALRNPYPLKFPTSSWRTIEEYILCHFEDPFGFKRRLIAEPITLGLITDITGPEGFSLDVDEFDGSSGIESQFPYVLLTNAHTASHVTYGMQILGFGTDSHLALGMHHVTNVATLGERGDDVLGLGIYFRQKPRGRLQEAFLSGRPSHGFLLTHENKNVYPLEDVKKPLSYKQLLRR